MKEELESSFFQLIFYNSVSLELNVYTYMCIFRILCFVSL